MGDGMLERARRLFEEAALAPDDSSTETPRLELVGRIGKFALLEQVGEGASSLVYRAIDEDLKREVAIKVLRPELRTVPGMCERFLGEFRTAARLRHPHVVLVHETGEKDGVPFAALEWMQGTVPKGPLPASEALGIALAAARALEAVHGAGFVHSDVKPQNLLVREGVVKLADFGVARELLGARPASGTPAFMAPEQAAGTSSEIDHRTDVYNLGATLLSLLTGEPPHRSLEEARLGKLSLPASLPRRVRRLIARATAHSRTDRHQTMTELRREIEAALRPSPAWPAIVSLGLVLVLLASIVLRLLGSAPVPRVPAPVTLVAPVRSESTIRRVFARAPFNKRTLAPVARVVTSECPGDPLLRLLTDKNDDMEQALELLAEESADPDRIFLRGFLRHYQSETRRALQDYERAAELDSWPELALYEGYARISAGETDRALACADRLGSARETDGLALRGAARLAAGDHAHAARDLEAAHSRDDSRLDVRHDLALAEIGLGRLEEARALLGSTEDDPAFLYARFLASPDAPPAERLTKLVEVARTAVEYKDASSLDESDRELAGHRPFVLWSLGYRRIERETDLEPLKKLPGFRRLATAFRER